MGSFLLKVVCRLLLIWLIDVSIVSFSLSDRIIDEVLFVFVLIVLKVSCRVGCLCIWWFMNLVVMWVIVVVIISVISVFIMLFVV